MYYYAHHKLNINVILMIAKNYMHSMQVHVLVSHHDPHDCNQLQIHVENCGGMEKQEKENGSIHVQGRSLMVS